MHNNKENSKPKDLKKSLSRLIKELSKYKLLIIISLILAIFGSILSIISPNKLSSLTDEITNGLMINKENFTSLNEQIYFNYTNNDLKEIEIDNIKEKCRKIYDIEFKDANALLNAERKKSEIYILNLI